MPTRHLVIVLAAVALVGASLGWVNGTRATKDGIQPGAELDNSTPRNPSPRGAPKIAAAKPVAVVSPEPTSKPDSADVDAQVENSSSATKPFKRYEFKHAANSQDKPVTAGQEASIVTCPSNPLALGKSADEDSDLVFVSRKDLERARNAANEAAAISTLRSVASAQAQIQSAGVIDTDGDSQGEYGYFGELSGSVPCRVAPGNWSERMEPAVLSSAFGEISRAGNVSRSGYVYRMYLPGPTASNRQTRGLPESAGGGWASGTPRPDADNCEVLWAAYAWPIEASSTGVRAFFINQEGDLLVMANADGAYSGEQRAPAFDAAFSARTPGDMAAGLVPGAKCNDGHVWSLLDFSQLVNETPAELGPATQADLEMNARPDSERVVVSRSLMRRANISGNEAGAIQTMRIVSSAQAQIQAAGVIDTDEDSSGEYAFFAELAGTAPCRASPANKRALLEPALLGSSFGKISSAGNLLRSGYVFRIYLPGPTKGMKTPGIAEAGGGGAGTGGVKPDHDNCEVGWGIYAWPIEAGKTGARAFFMNQEGDLYWTGNADGAYSGEAHAPVFDAACSARQPGDMLAPLPAPGEESNDGRAWFPIG